MYFLGIDPGGTKCEACLCDQDGNILGYENWTKDCHPEIEEINNIEVDAGFGRSPKVIKNIINILLKKVPENSEVHLGGCYAPTFDEYKEHPQVNTTAEYICEYSIPFYAEGIEKGFLALAGTGAICYYYDDNDNLSIDGLGPTLGDYGGGCYIGLQAIRKAARSEWSPQDYTSLGPRISQILLKRDTNHRGHDLIKFFFNMPNRSFVASFAKIVDEEAEKGDETAINILKEAAFALADTMRCVVYNAIDIEENLPIIGNGSVICKSRIYKEAFVEAAKKLLPGHEVITVSIPPCFGAVIFMGNKYANLDLKQFQQKIKKNFLELEK